MNTEAPSSPQRIDAREILRRAWPLFQETLLRCLPLAVLGAAASAVPEAEAAASRQAGGMIHTREWWGVLLASSVLTVICYDTVLRLQLAAAGRQRAAVMETMRRSVAALPGTLVLLLLSLAPLLPPLLWIGLRGFNWVAGIWLLAGLVGLMFVFLAWPLRAEGRPAWDALRQSILLVRMELPQATMLCGILLAAVLVFALLTSIFLGVVMMIAGPNAEASHVWLSVSRWLMAGVLAVPVVYVGAVSVTAYRQVTPRAD